MKRVVLSVLLCLCLCAVASASMIDHRYDLKLLLHGNLEPTGFSTSDFRDSSRYFAMPYANPNTSGVVNVNSTLYKYGNASIFVKGTKSNVTIADSDAYTFGTNNHSICAWIRYPTTTEQVTLFSHYQDGNNYDEMRILPGTTKSLSYNRYRGGVSVGSSSVEGASVFAPGIWYQICAIQNGTTTQMYVNGTAAGASYSRTGSLTDLNAPIRIGDFASGITGYAFIDEVIVTNGGLAPSIEDLQGEFPLYLNGSAGGYADDNYTKSLLHFDGVDGGLNITDQYANRTWMLAAGQATASNSSRFGAAGLFSPGAGKLLNTSSVSDFDMGSGDWTVEVWLKPLESSFSLNLIYPTGGTIGYGFVCGDTACYIASNNSATTTISTDLTDSTAWGTVGTYKHIAATRNGTTLRIYRDGQLSASGSIPSGYVYKMWGGDARFYSRNISADEYRVTKGLSRWAANFTPQVDPYELITNQTWTPTPDAAGTIPATIQFNDTTPSTAWTANTYNWSFGDAGGYSSLQNPSHVYSGTGIFNVTGNVFNNNMTVALTKTMPIGAPNVAYACTPITGTAALTVTCTDLTTNYTPITSYLMDFGDGTTSTDTPPWIHVYATYGSFSTNLTETNSVGTGYEYKRDYVVVSTDQSTVLENFVPKEIQFSVVDSKNNRVLNAPVNASVIASSFPTGTDWLVSLYSVDPTAANQMLNGTLMMQGHTDSTGSIVFTMQPSLQYNISVIVPSTGVMQSISLYPTESGSPYTIHILGTAVNNTYMDIGYNTSLYVYEPNASYATFELAYQDMSGRTTLLEYFLVDRNNATPLLINYQSTAAVGTNTVRMNYTLPNIRANRYSWYYNAVRTL